MHKKLTKYIESYDEIETCETYSLIPNGGMIVLLNQENNCEVIIDDNTFHLEAF